MQIVSLAWTVKAYFLGKTRKKYQFVVCWICPESGENLNNNKNTINL